MIDFGGLAYLPSSLWSVCLFKLFGYRQKRPWLGYRAVNRLDEIIKPDWSILEFGSGMSSLFFARRCRRLVTVESDSEWYERMQGFFAEQGFGNVDYRLRGADDYTAHADLPERSFDLVVVDGLVRDRCALTALEKVKSGGYVFFDNSDVPWAEHQAARRTLTEAADVDGVTLFDDFYPFQVQVNESMLVRVKSDTGAPNQAL
jgi:predicted O-methyltransferase YrrM